MLDEVPARTPLPSKAVFRVEFVTPGFLGGADTGGAPEWRGASIRGQLRWWLRAVAGGVFAGDVDKVRGLEGELFGTTSRSSNLAVRPLEHPRTTIPAGTARDFGRRMNEADLAAEWKDVSSQTLARLRLQAGASNPVQYLGYGCLNPQGASVVFVRSAIAPGQPASFCVLQRRRLTPNQLELLRDALWAWLNLGGIGAKSRKGFGSLRCVGVEGGLWRPEDLVSLTVDAFEEKAMALLSKASSGGPASPEWSHLSRSARIHVAQPSDSDGTWDAAMARVGSWLIAFRRRYGQQADGRRYGGRSVSNRDYEWAARRGRSPRAGVPDRSGFGLPLPFGKEGETVTWSPPDDHRRASPLLIHISRFGDRYVPILTHLPARLIPKGQKIGFRHQSGSGTQVSPEQERIIQDFLSDLEAKGLIKAVCP